MSAVVRSPSGLGGEIRGPVPERPLIEAWSDRYIPFERRTAEQEQLRSEIRRRLRGLTAASDEVLRATFLGAKPRGADVENLALYNMDDSGGVFANAARFGLRFELAASCPTAPSGKEYPYGYRYELGRRSDRFRHWQVVRVLATWDLIELGHLSGAARLATVWLALARRPIAVASPPRASEAPFAVRLTIRPPAGVTPPIAGLVKGIFDGVVCAFQAQADRSNLPEVASRLSRTTPASSEEIEMLLVKQEKAVLGTVPRLLHLRGESVMWAPADDLCVAGVLLGGRPLASATTWALMGDVVELQPA